MSVRSTERLTGVHRDTILGLLVDAGRACERFLDERVRNVPVDDVEADEIWGFVWCKQKTKNRLGLGDEVPVGDAYCFVAIERDTKLVLCWHLGQRTTEDTEVFIEKLRRGITIEGKRTLACDIERIRTTGRNSDEGNSWFEVKLREGRTQQIRKMFQAVGHPVSKLRRVAIGPISDPKLTPGVWRELTKQEVKMLETMKEPKKMPKPRRTAARPVSRKKPAAKRTSAASRPKGVKRSASSRAETRSSTRRTPSPRPATPRPKVAAGKSGGSKKPAVRRAGARPSRSSARR